MRLRSLTIGNTKLSNNVLLAPMAGITDLPFRLICKEYGCGMVYTEMVSAKGLYYGSQKTEELLRIHPKEHPIGVQIFGSEPEVMGLMAQKISMQDIDIIDIDGLSCPKDCKNGQDALYEDVDRVVR